MIAPRRLLLLLLACTGPGYAQEMHDHDHGVPEKLGTISFPISCAPAVQQPFNRAVALLHSFAYGPAQKAFRDVAEKDPRCAMAHWGLAMTYFHPVWQPALPPETFSLGQKEAQEAVRLQPAAGRERGYIHAVALLFQANPALKPEQRTQAYEQAMGKLASEHRDDLEAQVFYAVALLSNASMADKTHARQKQAVAILDPLFKTHPDHPGIAHYLIHASDSAELASHGLDAARKYASIAPSAPHALHMPSHIFTRLGLWDDSIRSNLASEAAARAQGDIMGELHAMDYLVYAYVQTGREKEARQVIADMKAMPKLDMTNFAIAYASAAMPVRVAVEGEHWKEAIALAPPQGVPDSVAAIPVWAKGLGLARTGRADDADAQAARLRAMEARLRTSGDMYWADQTGILATEVAAWATQARGNDAGATALMRDAAEKEDALEKRPVTPGPIVPAREQLGELLLAQNKPGPALAAFQDALAQAPGRAGSLHGADAASKNR
jgi:hypothetical protein